MLGVLTRRGGVYIFIVKENLYQDSLFSSIYENVANKNNVDDIIYQSSKNKWYGWNRQYGNIYLFTKEQAKQGTLLNTYTLKKRMYDPNYISVAP